jgi:hypothetical protein
VVLTSEDRLHRKLLAFFVSLLLALHSAPATRAEDVAPRPTLDIRIQGDDWSASSADIEKVVQSAAAQLLPYFPGRKLNPILLARGGPVPITLDRKGPAGEFQVRLATHSTFWSQYTYQFAHELCHILARYDHHTRAQHQWFEESLCEAASLFVLSKMHAAWEKDPPYPNWKSWGANFDTYLNQMLADRTRRLPPDQTMAQWIRANLPELGKEQQVTAHSKLLAAYLLPIFQDEPEGWECITWLNDGEKDNQLEFEAYLRSWKSRVPEKHKLFIAKIQKLFGYKTV